MMVDRIPHFITSAGVIRWGDTGAFTSGGQSVFGETQERSMTGGGEWEAAFSEIEILTEADARVWEALRLNWSLGDTRVVVPRCAGRARASFVGTAARNTHSDGTSFSDGSLYVGGSYGTLATTVGLRQTEALITLPEGAALTGAEPFTMVGPRHADRLYAVARVLAVDTGTNTYTVRFAKPARETYLVGTEVDFGDPRCVMRPLIGEGQGWPEYDTSWNASLSMVFRETFR